MFVTVLLLICAFHQVLAAAPASAKVSASIRDTSVNGFEGFNINVAAPFMFKNYLVGFRYALGNLKRAPESLFASHTFATPADGTARVYADYHVEGKLGAVEAVWESEKHGLQVSASADSASYLKRVAATKTHSLRANRLTLSAAYDVLKKAASGRASVGAEGTVVDLQYDTLDKAPVLSVTHALDENNEISPSIDLRSGDMSYTYKRSWTGGSLLGKYFPGDKLELQWRDEGSHGTWTTSAEVPVKDAAAAQVTVAHEWKY